MFSGSVMESRQMVSQGLDGLRYGLSVLGEVAERVCDFLLAVRVGPGYERIDKCRDDVTRVLVCVC